MVIQSTPNLYSKEALHLFNAVTTSKNKIIEQTIAKIPKDQLEKVFNAKNRSGMNVLEFAVYKRKMDIIVSIAKRLPNRILYPLLHKRENEQGPSLFDKIRDVFTHTGLYGFGVVRNLELHFNNPPFFTTPQFSNLIAQELAELMVRKDHDKFLSVLHSIKDKCFEICSCEDERKGINLLSFAAHLSNVPAVEAICSILDLDDLKRISQLKDHCRWTAFHHLAIMKDKGKCYKHIKKITGIDLNTISDYFCESPFMLRKYTKASPHAFKAVACTGNSGLHIYFRNGNPDSRVEHRLGFQDFIEKFGSLATVTPKIFQVIPYAKRKFFRHQWINGPLHQNENLAEVDVYLRKILEEKGEEGLALATVTHTDNGERVPDHINLGLGVESRKTFDEGEVVTLYGGKLLLPWEKTSASSIYAYGVMDGAYYRSYGSSLLHSFPNTDFVEMTCCLGKIFTVIKAVELIPDKAPLCVDYGYLYFRTRHITSFEIRPQAFANMRSILNSDMEVEMSQRIYLEDFEKSCPENFLNIQ